MVTLTLGTFPRWALVAVACVFLVGGGIAGVTLFGSGGDGPPAWNELSPSLTLEESTTEDLVYERINEAREERDLDTLAADSGLQAVARNHSEDMSEREYFDHTNPDGLEPEDRVRRAGLSCAEVGENIIEMPRQNHEEPLAEDAVQAWLDSVGHLINIIEEDWTRTGVGVAADDDTVYITQLFCE